MFWIVLSHQSSAPCGRYDSGRAAENRGARSRLLVVGPFTCSDPLLPGSLPRFALIRDVRNRDAIF